MIFQILPVIVNKPMVTLKGQCHQKCMQIMPTDMLKGLTNKYAVVLLFWAFVKTVFFKDYLQEVKNSNEMEQQEDTPSAMKNPGSLK